MKYVAGILLIVLMGISLFKSCSSCKGNEDYDAVQEYFKNNSEVVEFWDNLPVSDEEKVVNDKTLDFKDFSELSYCEFQDKYDLTDDELNALAYRMKLATNVSRDVQGAIDELNHNIEESNKLFEKRISETREDLKRSLKEVETQNEQ